MKLLFVEYGGLRADNGLNLTVVELIRQLIGQFEIDLASVCAEEEDRQTPLPDGVGYYILLKGNKRIRQTLPAFRPMRRLLREKQYDYVILQGNACAAAVLPAACFTHTKVIYADHAVLDPYDKRDYFYWERRFESLLCKRVITLTKQSRETYLRAFSLPPGKVVVIPNITPVYEGSLCTPERKELVSVMRFAPEKGPESIVKVAIALKKRMGHFTWRIWGSGFLEQELREEIEKNELGDEVLLMGTTKDKNKLYGTAGALVMTSRYEGWGLVLTEALSRGIPTFAFDVPFGPAALINDRVNGALIKPFDHENMAERLEEFLMDESLRAAMIAHTQDGLSEYYPEKVRDKWIELLYRPERKTDEE